MFFGRTLSSAEPIGTTLSGTSEISRRRASAAHWPISPSPSMQPLGMALARPLIGIAGEQAQARHALGLHQIDDAVLRVDQRRQFRQQHAADRREIALALEHVGEAREVGLEPVLLFVAIRRETEIVDHRVDVVFELGDFAARIDLDRPGQVALGHGGRHFGDRAHLRREVRGQQIDVTGQVLPRAGGARARWPDRRDGLRRRLRARRSSPDRRRCQRVGHVVDGLGQRRDLALRLHGELLRRSPLATAVTTFTMPRTCSVRLAAMTLTVSVKSFHVPATPGTSA